MTPASIHEGLQELLSEGANGARQRERNTFDELAGPFANSLVLFGAGGIGRKTLAGLRTLGIEPLAFADNNPALWGKLVNGLQVLSPQEASARHRKSALFVVTIWSGEGHDRMRDRIRLLHELGCEHIITFGPLYWKYASTFLPHYAAGAAHGVHGQREAVLQAAELWADEASRREYLAQIRWRLHFDFDALADPVEHTIYFPADLCPLIPGEVFVDCGAYDGDTLVSFLAQAEAGFAKVFAFEPDSASFAKLKERVAQLAEQNSIVLQRAAIGADDGFVLFTGDGTPAARMGTGHIRVACAKLDSVLKDECPTYLKMDIEGAELDALQGAREIIAQHSPVLAICCYHKQDHLWKIPLLIQSINAEYRFFLRPHWGDVWDLVCYAIPVRRLRPAVQAW